MLKLKLSIVIGKALKLEERNKRLNNKLSFLGLVGINLVGTGEFFVMLSSMIATLNGRGMQLLI